MSEPSLAETALALVAGDKGILAIDESNGTCNARFAALGIPQTVEARRAWRELILTTPGLGRSISGVILYDETIRQAGQGGTSFVDLARKAGMLVGIKVDTGAKPFAGHPGETLTEGLDGLAERLVAYREMGAHFAKWRAVLAIGESRPSHDGIVANVEALARYAVLCQAAGLVPIVEPEILTEGSHSLAVTLSVTQLVLRTLFQALAEHGAMLEGLILKPAMVLPGLGAPIQPTPDEAAEATLSCLLSAVPAAVPAVTFLSGGQDGELAATRLRALNVRASEAPWALSFSFGRAIQQPALSIWSGDATRVLAAQSALLVWAEASARARRGEDEIRARPAA